MGEKGAWRRFLSVLNARALAPTGIRARAGSTKLRCRKALDLEEIACVLGRSFLRRPVPPVSPWWENVFVRSRVESGGLVAEESGA